MSPGIASAHLYQDQGHYSGTVKESLGMHFGRQ